MSGAGFRVSGCRLRAVAVLVACLLIFVPGSGFRVSDIRYRVKGVNKEAWRTHLVYINDPHKGLVLIVRRKQERRPSRRLGELDAHSPGLVLWRIGFRVYGLGFKGFGIRV